MLKKNKVIVISKIRYKDHDLIVKCFTKERGLMAYHLPGVMKNSKGKSKSVYYQLLSQLDIEEKYRSNQSLHYIKEVKLSSTYQTLHTNVYKSAIVMFLSEVLTSVLKEEETKSSIVYLFRNDVELVGL